MKTRSLSLLSHCLLGGTAITLLIASGCTTSGNSAATSGSSAAISDNSGAEPAATEKHTAADTVPANESATEKTDGAAKSAVKPKNSGSAKKVTKTGINWRPSFEAAMAEAKRTQKPVIVDFYATWCPPCKLMEKETWSDPTIIKESENWIMVKVNSEKRPDVFAQYSPGSLPTVVFLRPNAKPANGFLGFRSAEDLLGLMRSAYTQATGDPQAA